MSTEKNPCVLIMMASYNGGSRIRKQIESIIGQDYTNWILAIQDDGSSDNTVSIIREYQNGEKRIEFYINTGTHGPYYNFHSLANKYKGDLRFDYMMFSDQDDIWYSDKISTFVKKALNDDESIPKLYYADMRVVDASNNILYESMNITYHIDIVNKYNAFLVHKVFGCNTFMNKKLFNLVPRLDMEDTRIKNLSHDNFYTKHAVMLGEIQFINQTTMDFIRHGSNTTSKQQYKPTLSRFFERLININGLASAHANLYSQSLFTIDLIAKEHGVSDEKMILMKFQKKVILNGGFKALEYINNHHIYWGNKIETISRKLILLLGIYKKYLRDSEISDV